MNCPATDNKTLASANLLARFRPGAEPSTASTNPHPKDLEEDLNGATATNNSLAQDPTFVESKIAEGSCYGYLMYLNMKKTPRACRKCFSTPARLKEAMAAAPENPRPLWC
jgi:hypothetical protein